MLDCWYPSPNTTLGNAAPLYPSSCFRVYRDRVALFWSGLRGTNPQRRCVSVALTLEVAEAKAVIIGRAKGKIRRRSAWVVISVGGEGGRDTCR